jgi:DNA polymerase-3 subunit delta
MRISADDLPRELKRACAPLYTVFGDEPLLAFEAGDRIRARARADGCSEREVLIAEQHFDWSLLKASGASGSLFGSRRLLDLRIPGGKPGVDGGQALTDYCARLPDDAVTLITLPEIDWRSQKSAWFSALEQAGVMVEAKSVPRAALPEWLDRRFKAQDQRVDPRGLEFIADKVEGNLLAGFQEVQKLALLFGSGDITFEQVKDAVLDVARFDLFELGPIVMAGDAQRYARMLEGLRGEGAAPPLVLWSISDEIRALARVLAGLAAGQPLPQALRAARIWGPAREQAMRRASQRFRAPTLEAALRHAARIDRMIKGLAPGDVWDELMQLGLRFAQPAGRD